MAEKAKWTLSTKGVATCTMPDQTFKKFDITEVVPDFLSRSVVEQFLIFYGLKQKLADRNAKKKDEAYTYEERLANMQAIFDVWKTGKLPVSQKRSHAKVVLNENQLEDIVAKATEEELAVLRRLNIVKD